MQELRNLLHKARDDTAAIRTSQMATQKAFMVSKVCEQHTQHASCML